MLLHKNKIKSQYTIYIHCTKCQVFLHNYMCQLCVSKTVIDNQPQIIQYLTKRITRDTQSWKVFHALFIYFLDIIIMYSDGRVIHVCTMYITSYKVMIPCNLSAFLWPVGPSLWLLSHGFDVCLYIYIYIYSCVTCVSMGCIRS